MAPMDSRFNELVPRPLVAKELNLSSRTICRYEKAKIPGFDEPVVINGRVFHRRSKIEEAKRGSNRASMFYGTRTEMAVGQAMAQDGKGQAALANAAGPDDGSNLRRGPAPGEKPPPSEGA
jgi:hypothetical protein